ncbi:phospholipid/cholesterol/gamma-HCH transport system substrate-binding protein [Thiohalomonas denitrificans]|uniref:Phospholipid/cholesterol/gamma-HCH transport system substrate-binding protein n=2 Tax=Thiohalomonas denitrificans TaxID=415747 RepID=A0A1G5PND8_9GAMM|nr:phospholipid/cholesterol/gamma-HCH transport system substrate-binding protein [Thiohalomonas denitrificans]
MRSRMIEIWVGVFVAGGLAALSMLAMQVSNLTSVGEADGYEIKARFDNISGLNVRSPVTMAGVRIGRVVDIDFDEKTFEAVVSMRIESQYDQLPEDSSASVFTSGLLGEKYVGLEPGGALDNLADGDVIHLTQSSLVLERLIGQFLFSQGSDDSKEGAEP